MRRFFSFVKLLVPTVVSIVIFSCSAAELNDFQVNDFVEYRMFNLLDDYPSIYEAVNSLDQTTFNRLLGDAVNHKTNQFIAMSRGTNDLLSYKTDPDGAGYHEKDPVHELLERAKSLLARLMDQDQLDSEIGATSYVSDLFGFIDSVRLANVGYESDIVSIMSKSAEHTVDMEYSFPGHIVENIGESILDMTDPDTLISAKYNQKKLAKMLLISDTDITDGLGNPMGLGNSVQGIRALLKGVIELLQNAEVRDSIYDIVREMGKAAAAEIPTTDPTYNADIVDYAQQKYAKDGVKRVKDVLREEMENKEDYFTVGGKEYSKAGDDLYRRNSTTEYADAEARNVSKEQLPHMISLLLRGDRPDFLFAPTGNKDYFAERFVTALKKLNIDWDKSHLEESLYDMIRYDTYGRDRLSDTSGAYDISMLEATMMTGGVTANMGWTDGGATGESSTQPNASHGHGAPVGNITLNDSIFGMKTANDDLAGGGMYELVLGINYDPAGQHDLRIFRSKDPFTSADALAGKCELKYNQNFCALNFLATHCVGDVGHPTGGNPNNTTAALNQFVPYSPTGTKDTNTAAFNMNWVARGCYNGEGPYYYADPNATTTEVNGKTYYRYLRANGKLYAYVHKDSDDPNDSTKWEYLYPVVNGEPADVISYTAEIPVTNAVYHSNEVVDGRFVLLQFKIRIKIGTTINAVATFGPIATYDIDDVVNVINNAINSAAGSTLNLCSLYDPDNNSSTNNFLKIVAPPGQTIEISNANNPDTTSDNPVQVFLQQDFGDNEVKIVYPNSFKINNNATVNIKIDQAVNANVSFSVLSPDYDGWWTGPELTNTIINSVGSAYVSGSESNIILEGKSTTEGIAKIELSNVSGNGMSEIFGSAMNSVSKTFVERYHRYRESWRTDYYMIRRSTKTPPDTSGSTFYTPADMVSGAANNASCFVIKEIIPESEPKRACASQEEALYRNLQWILTEKKITLIVPMYLFVNALGCIKQDLAFFQIVEGNGFEGLVNARKFRTNRVWAKKGTTGHSIIPGDYRLYVETSPEVEVALGIMLGEDKVMETVGYGSANPPIIPHTFASISRLAFPRSDVSNRGVNSTVYGNEYGNAYDFLNFSVGSREFSVDDDDPVWKLRNGLVPLIVTALSTAWELSDENNKGILRVLDSQFASLKPLFFFNKNGSGVMSKSWLPRIAGSEAHIYDFMMPDQDVPGFSASTSSPTGYFGGWATRNYYQLKSMPTSMTFMVDSDPSRTRSNRIKRADGFIASLTYYKSDEPRGDNNLPNTRLITKLLKVLDKVGSSSFADPDPENIVDEDISTFGTRRKLFYGAEQVMTNQRIIKNASTYNLTTIDETSFKNLDFPSWMFTNTTFVDANNDGLHDGTYSDIRPGDIVVDEDLNLSIGSDTLGMGLAKFTDVRAPDYVGTDKRSWKSFNDAADKAVEFTSNLGKAQGKYNITENLVNLIDKFFTRVTVGQDEINSLVHTLGIINAYHDGSEWKYPEELIDIQTKLAPTMADIGKAHAVESAEFNLALMVEGGLIDYVLNTMETPFSTEEIVSDFQRLLNHRLIAQNEDSRNSILWSDLIEMNEGLIASLLDKLDPVVFTEMNDFQYNGPWGESIFDAWDPFGDLGKVFSQ